MKKIISIKKLSKEYEVGETVVKALDAIDLDIYKNEFLAIMGSSGSGKSTLLNLLGCLDVPTSGDYELNGNDISKMSDDELSYIRSREIGFVFQNFNLLAQYNALDNVLLPLIYTELPHHERVDRAKESLIAVGLENRQHHKPHQLSGGQKQRVAIARALVNNPSIILADEPTGNLDSKSSGEIMALVEKIHNMGNTIVLVTHEDNIAEYADNLLTLADGKITGIQKIRSV